MTRATPIMKLDWFDDWRINLLFSSLIINGELD